MSSTKKFLRVLHEMEQLIQKRIQIQVSNPNFSPFEQLSIDQQKIISRHAHLWLKILKEMQRDQENWLDSQKLFRVACKHLNLSPDPHLFKLIESNDLVEIYSSNGLPIFRSFNLLLDTRFSLETLLCCSWDQLTERDPEITRKIWAKLRQTLETGETKTIAWNIETHLLYETHHEKKYPFHFELKYLSLFSKNEIVQGFISTASFKRHLPKPFGLNKAFSD